MLRCYFVCDRCIYDAKSIDVDSVYDELVLRSTVSFCKRTVYTYTRSWIEK
jgi:hypothetical protein